MNPLQLGSGGEWRGPRQMVRNGDWHSVADGIDFCIATLALRMQNLDILWWLIRYVTAMEFAVQATPEFFEIWHQLNIW